MYYCISINSIQGNYFQFENYWKLSKFDVLIYQFLEKKGETIQGWIFFKGGY